MGTIAARDCLRILQLTEQVAASTLLAAVQALELRQRQGELTDTSLTDAVRSMQRQVLGEFAFVTEDRPLEADLRATVTRIQQRHWDLY